MITLLGKVGNAEGQVEVKSRAGWIWVRMNEGVDKSMAVHATNPRDLKLKKDDMVALEYKFGHYEITEKVD